LGEKIQLFVKPISANLNPKSQLNHVNRVSVRLIAAVLSFFKLRRDASLANSISPLTRQQKSSKPNILLSYINILGPQPQI